MLRAWTYHFCTEVAHKGVEAGAVHAQSLDARRPAERGTVRKGRGAADEGRDPAALTPGGEAEEKQQKKRRRRLQAELSGQPG